MSRARRVAVEVLVVAGVLAVVLASEGSTGTDVGLGLLATLVLPLRHRFPRTTVVAVVPALVSGVGLVPGVVAMHGLGRARPDPRALAPWVLLCCVALNLVNALQDRVPSWYAWLPTLVFSLGVSAGPAAVGALSTLLDTLGRSRAAAGAAREETARAEERAHLAREVHDSVGHHVALLALEAAVLETTAADPEVRAGAARMRVRARTAMDEARDALGLLDPAPGPDEDVVEQVQRLVRTARESGVDATLVVAADEDGAGLDALSPAVQRAAVRVVQEGLTNAVKHAPGAAVRVHAGVAGRAVHLQVTSGPGPSLRGTAPCGRGGTGLAGLAERLRVLGGRLTVDVAPDGAHVLGAVLPVVAPPGRTPADRP